MRKIIKNLLFIISIIFFISAIIFGFLMVGVRYSALDSQITFDIFGLPAGNDFNLINIFFTLHGWIELIGFWGLMGIAYGIYKLAEKL